MLISEDFDGLLFHPLEDVASLTPEYRHRWRVVDAVGRVSSILSPPPPGPWVPAGGSLVHPKWIHNGFDPAGFSHPAHELPPAPPPPQPVAIEGLPCNSFEVVRLEGVGENGLACTWYTDRGEFRWDMSASRAAALHPDLLQFQRGVYVNRRRLASLRQDGATSVLTLDDGSQYRFHNTNAARLLARRLGLPHVRFLEPEIPGLRRLQVRDYPYELASAPDERLRADFSSARQLLANLVWQTYRWRSQGQHPDYGNTYRGYWYVPVVATLYRAGFLTRAQARVLPDGAGRSAASKLYLQLQELVAEMVGEHRLFEFQQLGFKDPRPELRCLGQRHPEIVLIAEKESLHESVKRIGREFGLTTLLLGGAPSLVETEYFVRALQAVAKGPIRVLALVDFDPGGWIIAESFVQQCLRFGLEVGLDIHYLVRAEVFTPQELQLYAIPCPTSTPTLESRAQAWLNKGGGIGGKALGIHANHLQPYQRVKAEVEKALGGPGPWAG